MTTINRFEDIEAWKKARLLAKAIYQVTSLGTFAHDRALKDQMRRASVSVLSNIAEGFERDGSGEFKQFLAIAKASVGEVRAQLYVALDARLIDEAQFSHLHRLSIDTSNLLAGFIKYLSRTSVKGLKFKSPPTPN
ncbi:MAG: four helix bundle protein [Candidatus Sericytochromatia bacterium]